MPRPNLQIDSYTMGAFNKKKNTIPGQWLFKLFKDGAPFMELPAVYLSADSHGGWSSMILFFPNS